MTLTSGLLVRGLSRRDHFVLDALLAVALVVACALSAAETPVSGGWREPFWAGLLTAVLIGAPVVVRRIWPAPALALSLSISAVALVSGVITDYASGSVVAVLACELYLVGAEVATRPALTMAGSVAVLTGALILSPGDQGSTVGTAFAGLVVAVAWMLGRVRRERRLHADQVAEQRTARAVGDERLRIARELHDVVAHSMSLIAVRAGVAHHVFDARPLEARAALSDIEAASRRALSQVRQVVEVLREPDGSYDPVPGLADLPSLAADAMAAGVHVRLTLAGEEVMPQVPEAVGLSAFRIVQESLTNVLKHGATPACTVSVTVTPAEVRIRVADDVAVRALAGGAGQALSRGGHAVNSAGQTVDDSGRAVNGGGRALNGDSQRPKGGGQGLIGMRERVAAWGGDFSAGPRPGEGFVVTATLPYRGPDS